MIIFLAKRLRLDDTTMLGDSEMRNEASKIETERTENNSRSHTTSRAETTITNSQITTKRDMITTSYNIETVNIYRHEESLFRTLSLPRADGYLIGVG